MLTNQTPPPAFVHVLEDVLSFEADGYWDRDVAAVLRSCPTPLGKLAQAYCEPPEDFDRDLLDAALRAGVVTPMNGDWVRWRSRPVRISDGRLGAHSEQITRDVRAAELQRRLPWTTDSILLHIVLPMVDDAFIAFEADVWQELGSLLVDLHNGGTLGPEAADELERVLIELYEIQQAEAEVFA